MYYYENLARVQPTVPEIIKCPVVGPKTTCFSGPTPREMERSRVLEISRAKLQGVQTAGNSCCEGVDADRKEQRRRNDTDIHNALRVHVTVRNTVRKLEADLHREIMEAFASPF